MTTLALSHGGTVCGMYIHSWSLGMVHMAVEYHIGSCVFGIDHKRGRVAVGVVWHRPLHVHRPRLLIDWAIRLLNGEDVGSHVVAGSVTAIETETDGSESIALDSYMMRSCDSHLQYSIDYPNSVMISTTKPAIAGDAGPW
jgi:hypothetical protein